MKTIFASLLLLAAAIGARAGDLKTLKAGDTCPGFALKNYDGTAVVLDSVLKKNTYTVVMFIATKCPVSAATRARSRSAARPGS